MNIAFISDIHGNYEALKACLRFVREYSERRVGKIDHIVFLGDYITDGPWPEKTMDQLYEIREEYPCTFLRGNREEYLLDGRKQEKLPWRKDSETGALLYTYEHMREKDWAFIESLPNHSILKLKGREPITIAHGSQFASRANYYEDPETGDAFLDACTTKIMVSGHSHTQHMVERKGKLYINPGSVGESQNGSGAFAQFCVLQLPEEGSDARINVENYTIPYNVNAYIKAFEDSGIQDYCPWMCELVKLFCLSGINFFMRGIGEIQRIKKEIPKTETEEAWKQAAHIEAAVWEQQKSHELE